MGVLAELIREDDETETPPPEPTLTKGDCLLSSDGGEFKNVTMLEDIGTDWTPIFRKFNLDPDHFEIIDDTVSIRLSQWQQSKRTDNGDRDVIDLQAWKYSARFKRISTERVPESVVAEWRDSLRTVVRPATPGLKYPNTYVMFIADPQLGKKNTGQAVENWKRGVAGHCDAIRTLINQNRSPSAVHVAWMGDETEGVCNNYGNQPHTVELNLSKQLELDFDLRVWTLKQVAELGLPISASSVISNHGEWSRNGSKEPVTSQGDNASTHIARQVQKLFSETEAFGGSHIDWTIGDGDPAVLVNLSGVDCYFSHGYIEKGKGGSTEIRTKSAIERQILGRTDTLGNVPLWFMAHYHHFYTNEFEGRTLFGMPALEAERSSEYMLNQYGVWSKPGMLGMLVGEHTERRWSDLSVL